ncbi:glycoside hydrolase family 15 protein [Noviherbaspirillum pedocola]|uniref:Glycoside hydrolase family 15 protein n=1 Tax=Noviherbaspirillum pedocola TaxID=2801341 RepID=A0A934W8B1_9BURK|nr:glycoside hydrolase family 15 protein [Noviherbaspirillum pedocola]MBK4736588.1 glycoside hydrolase family 15 protein [Noviherbaspirillum pedocola]
MDPTAHAYPPIADYALIGNCQCAALVSRSGSIDWCCMPRIDADSCFGRLLDWRIGGHCAVFPSDPDAQASRRYLPHTMVLETHWRTKDGEALVLDYFAMSTRDEDLRRQQDHPRLVRVIRGIAGRCAMRIEILPRFDYGAITPHVAERCGMLTAIGSNVGLAIRCDAPLKIAHRSDLYGECSVSAGEECLLSIEYHPPEDLDDAAMLAALAEGPHESCLQTTCDAWQAWQAQIRMSPACDEQTQRSALVLKSLGCERTGAIAAAPTTSLPEWPGGERNWDYRYSWVRDSVFTVRALYELGCHREADRFLGFITRSSAGSAEELQIMYAVDGKRRLTEVELGHLEGYARSRPVRVGNLAAEQKQGDVYGEVMELAWEWHSRGRPIAPHYWNFLADVANTACRQWQQPDSGIWELRGPPRHLVHSKVMCWGALDRAVRLATEQSLPGPVEEWGRERDRIRADVEKNGYDSKRGVFLQCYGKPWLDAALLLLPRIGFVAHDDPRMVRTVDAIRHELDRNGLLLRYNAPDNLPGSEGVFLPCTFWLAACLARQGRKDEAWAAYRRASACANKLGLFSEEYDPEGKRMLGNFPQALTHVSQIMARLALG